MTLRERVGTIFRQPEATEAKPKEKLSTSGLGAGFLELFRPSLQNNKTASEQLIKSFYGWVYANVSAIAEEVSKIEPELYVIRFEKGEIKYDRVLEHPLLDLLDKFNTVNTASEAFYVTAANLELVGDSFYLKDRAIQPTELYLLDPTKVEVNPRSDGFGVANYVYKRIVNGQTKDIIYKPEQILPIKHPNPENPLRGKSTVAASATAIDTANLAQEFLKNFFQNGAIVNFALTTEQKVTPEQIRRIQQQLKREYGGVANAFKALILGGGFKVEQVQHSNKEMDILPLLEALRDYIMAMFKNTKSSLGIVEDVNRANAEASLASWKNSVIKPKMMRIVDALNEYLVPDYGDNLVLGFKDPVPEDREAKITEASGLVNKVITVNEARTMLGYPELPDPAFDELISEREKQDQAAEQAKQRFQQQTPKALQNINLSRHLRHQGVYRRYETYKSIYQAARKVAEGVVTRQARKKAAKAAPKPVVKTYSSFSDLDALKYWQKQMSQVETVEHTFRVRLDQYLQGIEDKAVSQLHAATTTKGTLRKVTTKSDLVNHESEVQTGIDLFTPLMEEIAGLSAVEAYDLLNISRIYTPTAAIHATIREYVELMADSVVSTDTSKLEDILREGIDTGQAIAEIERRMRAEFANFRKNQTEKIARTEVIRASNAGALDAYKQSGVVQFAQWYTAQDDRVDEECAGLDGKIVPLGGKFFNDDYGSGEEPPIHPQCRCTLLPVVE